MSICFCMWKIEMYFIAYTKTHITMQNAVQVTSENARQYIGREIIFTTRGQKTIKTILGVSETGKTIHIDHPDLKNQLQIVTRKVYLLS